MRAALQRLSAKPHNVGTPYDSENAEWLLAQYKSYGLKRAYRGVSGTVPHAA